jgi:hypothetical protein
MECSPYVHRDPLLKRVGLPKRRLPIEPYA